MKHTKKIIRWSAVSILVLGLTGCYYPVYTPYPPAYSSYPSGYAAPAQQPAPPPHPRPQCREYHQTAIIDGKPQPLVGTACRQPDGSWRDAANGSPVEMHPHHNPPPPPPEDTATPGAPIQGTPPAPVPAPPPGR